MSAREVINVKDAVAVPTHSPGGVPLEQHDRITTQYSLVHESWGEDPTAVQATYTALCATAGVQPHYRRTVCEVTWAALQYGDVADPGHVVIQNRANGPHVVQPTEEERANIKRHVLEIGFARPGEGPPAHAALQVQPGGCQPLDLLPHTKVWVRAQHGHIRTTVYVFSR